jgi:hypothetical protein
VLNRSGQPKWTTERLRRTVRRLVAGSAVRPNSAFGGKAGITGLSLED